MDRTRDRRTRSTIIFTSPSSLCGGGPRAPAANNRNDRPPVTRGQGTAMIPALAISWRTLPNEPTVWEFKLRQNVKFHNGAAFNADDVVFSLNRAMGPTSDMKGLLTSIDSVTKV